MIARRGFVRFAAATAAAAVVPQSAAFAADKTQVKLASTYREAFDSLPLYVADHGGFFDKHGLAVDTAHFSGGGDEVRAVASGSSDLGMVGATAAILAFASGQRLKIISGFTAPTYGVVYVTLGDSPIRSVRDLVGKTVAFSRPGSVTQTALLAALKANGILDKVTMVPTGNPGDTFAALRTGRVQACSANAIQAQPLVAKGEMRILFRGEDYLTDYQQGVFIATDAYLAAHGDTAREFLAAVADAIKLAYESPSEAAKLGAKDLGATEQDTLTNLENAPKGWWRIGAPHPKDMIGSLAEARATGSLKEKPAYDQIVSTKFLP